MDINFQGQIYFGLLGKLWLFWAVGLNIFFGLINIMAVKWGYEEVKLFLIWFDIIVYIMFVGLVVWGLKVGRLLRLGAYITFVIFCFWIIWGYWVVR